MAQDTKDVMWDLISFRAFDLLGLSGVGRL